LNWNQIDQITRTENTTATEEKIKLQGGIMVALENFRYQSFTWRPVEADIAFDKDGTRIVVHRADLCGIQFPGIFKVTGDTFELDFKPVAKELDLDSSLTCLFDKQHLMAGSFDLNGKLLAKAKPSAFPKSLTGNMAFNSNDGRIYRFGMLAKIFALLNVTEIYRGEVPDLKGKGFAYNSMTARGVFEDGRLIISDTSIDSPSMGIAIEGDINLTENKVNLVVLVAPFKTVDRIVKIIPLVGNIMGGNLISIPFRAVGDLGDPDVIPLSPTAVGSGLLGILERTLKLPITIIQPVLPGSKDKTAAEENKSPLPSP
ncbi:MAG: AsmA-like C-terminal domain-containing protein, partial [Desulfobacterales bacterium]